MQIDVHLRDLGEPLVRAWQREFAGMPSVRISCGDIFSDQPGVVGSSAAIDVRADAIISPANSFGFMDGGIDAVYTYQPGPQVQAHLQARIVAELDGELPVGGKPFAPSSIGAAARDEDELLR